ncbi:MAG: MotA/TolQ/ExbB proton channel family protein [Akkermansia sp.]
MYQQIIQFFEACYPFGYPLLICSILMFTAILFHLMARNSAKQIQDLSHAWDKNKLGEYCRSHNTPLMDEVLFISQNKEQPDSYLQEQVETRLRLYIDTQRCGLTTISVITNIAPMLGILGTAWGLVDIFGIFGSPEAQAGIAMGISKALYTTIFGLAVAVPGVIALSAFERALERRAARISMLIAAILANRQQL